MLAGVRGIHCKVMPPPDFRISTPESVGTRRLQPHPVPTVLSEGRCQDFRSGPHPSGAMPSRSEEASARRPRADWQDRPHRSGLRSAAQDDGIRAALGFISSLLHRLVQRQAIWLRPMTDEVRLGPHSIPSLEMLDHTSTHSSYFSDRPGSGRADPGRHCGARKALYAARPPPRSGRLLLPSCLLPLLWSPTPRK